MPTPRSDAARPGPSLVVHVDGGGDLGPEDQDRLTAPLRADPGVALVVAARPGVPDPLVEIGVRPLLRLLAPGLAGLDDPLPGVWAGRADRLATIRPAPDEHPGLAVLLAVLDAAGTSAIAEVRLPGPPSPRRADGDDPGATARAAMLTVLRRRGFPVG